MPGSLNLLPEMLKNDSDFTNPAVLVLALKNTMSNTPASNAPMSDTAIEKAALGITKLEGRENWIRWSANIEMVLDQTWQFVQGRTTSPPQEDPPDFADWANGNRAACCRIWLALSDKVQDTVFRHLKSSAATLFKALKNQYEQSGASAEFYATKTYNNTKLSDYDSITDFLNVLMNLTHQVNKEIVDTTAHINDRAIAMHVIHSLPPSMHTLQTILIRSAPPSSKATWDLDTLKKDIEANEICAHTAGENLGTKLDSLCNPKALTIEEGRSKGKRKDPNDPTWLACQTCWRCGKISHLHQRCSVTQEERDAYREKKAAECKRATANATTDEAEDKVLVAKMLGDIALTAETQDRPTRQWIIDSGSTSHLCPNKSDFISYREYNSPHQICIGDTRTIPSFGEGTVSIICIVNSKTVSHHIQDIQYVPNPTYGLISCSVLNRRGLGAHFEDGVCKIRDKWGCLIAETVKEWSLYYLNTKVSLMPLTSTNADTALVIPPSFDLVHKQLAHLRKDTLQQMIHNSLVDGLTNVPDDLRDFDCIACIHGKMT